MIRTEDLRHYLATITQALSGPIMNDLQSVQTKELTGVLLVLLNRIQSGLVSGEAIAEDARPEWEPLREQASSVIGGAVEGQQREGDWQALDDEIRQVQQALQDPATFESFLARLKAGDPQARQWMHGMSHLMAKVNRNFENNFWQAPPKAAAAGGGDRNAELKEKLSAYLKLRFPSLPDDPIEKFAVVSGGQSKLSALFTLKPNDVLPRELALRLDIATTSTPVRLDTEYPVLKRVHEIGLPVPEPILFEPDKQYLGEAFVIMTQITDAKMAGSPFVEDRSRFGANTGPDFGREAAQLLATMHSKTMEPASAEAQVIADREALLGGLITDWRRLKKSSFSLAGDLAIAWLLTHPLPTGRPSCLIHGDYVQHNILTRDGKIAALLDWELATIGDPAADVAQCKCMLIGGTIEWEDFVREYLAAGGPPEACDPHAIAWYSVVLYLKHSVYQGNMRNIYLGEGNSHDFKSAIISGHFVDRLQLYQAEALRDAVNFRV